MRAGGCFGVTNEVTVACRRIARLRLAATATVGGAGLAVGCADIGRQHARGVRTGIGRPSAGWPEQEGAECSCKKAAIIRLLPWTSRGTAADDCQAAGAENLSLASSVSVTRRAAHGGGSRKTRERQCGHSDHL